MLKHFVACACKGCCGFGTLSQASPCNAFARIPFVYTPFTTLVVAQLSVG